MNDELDESHYHIMTGPRNQQAVADVVVAEYNESIGVFLSLVGDFYAEIRNMDYEEAIERALHATGFGAGRGAFIGSPSLMVYWLRCEETYHNNPCWN